jgi:hypothetical protein
MSKFLVFTYYAGRPLGGMSDYLDSFETFDQALDYVLPEPNRYFEIVDADSMTIIREGLSQFKHSAELEFQAQN